MKLYLTFFIIFTLIILSDAFFPSFEFVKESLYEKFGSKNPVKKTRAKRQSFERNKGAGDESSIPTEAQTST